MKRTENEIRLIEFVIKKGKCLTKEGSDADEMCWNLKIAGILHLHSFDLHGSRKIIDTWVLADDVLENSRDVESWVMGVKS